MAIKKLAVILALVGVVRAPAHAGPVPPAGCPNCIINSAAPQNAQINIGTETVRGTLTVGTLAVTNLTISTLNATTITGAGSGITALNASQLTSGTVPAARMSGSYTGITGVGTVAAGVWNGTAVGTQYGGTGQNFSTAGRGAVPFFSSVGGMSALSPGTNHYVLQAGGAGADVSWTGAPTVAGTNVTNIPLANLVTGNLPSAIKATDASLVTVSGSKVTGDIGGNAESINGTLPLGQLEDGTLGAGIIAQTLQDTAVTPGTYGALPSRTIQITVGQDGRLTAASQQLIAIGPSQITAGSLPSNVTVPAASIASGNLGSGVVAQTLNATGAAAGTYGGAAKALTATVAVDGRLSSLSQQNIALPTSQINSGDLPAGVLLPAASVKDGTLASGVIAQTLNASGVSAGTYGGSTQSVQIAVNSQGRITSAMQFTIPAVSTTAAWTDRYNNWTHAQVSQASWTITNVLVTGTLTAGALAGPGSAITALTPTNMSAGTLPGNVKAQAYADSSILTAALASGAVDSTKLSSDSVTTVKIVNGAVDTTKLAADAVTTVKILDANVTTAKVANAAITAVKMVNSGVFTGDAATTFPALTIANSAITTAKINNGAVDTTKLASDAVTNVKILNGTIDLAAKVTGVLPVANGGTGVATLTSHGLLYGSGTSAVAALAEASNGQLPIGSTGGVPVLAALTGDTQVSVSNGAGSITLGINAASIGTTQLGSASVDTTKLASDAVTTVKILNANVTAAKMVNAGVFTGDAVTTFPAITISASAITNSKIADGAVDTNKLATDAVSAIKILANAVTNPKIADGAVDTAKLATDSVSSVKILAQAVTAVKIADASIDTSKVVAGFFAIPVNSQSAAYSTVLADANKIILHPAADASARTFTIDGSVAYPVGTTLTFVNEVGAGVVTIAIGTDTLYWAGNASSTGSRTLTAVGIATATKTSSGKWVITGTGIT